MVKLTARQQLAYGAGLLTATSVASLYAVDGLEYLGARGPMNVGHESLACADCHQEAPGTLRQQLQATARYLVGLREKPADFGAKAIGNQVCLECHERPDDRHPVHRFLEPRFREARQALGVQLCGACHMEHTGRRVTGSSDFCGHCHSTLRVANDPIEPAHEELVTQRDFQSCLRCHDFHGNHGHSPPKRLEDAPPESNVRAYFEGAPSPYGRPKRSAQRPVKEAP